MYAAFALLGPLLVPIGQAQDAVDGAAPAQTAPRTEASQTAPPEPTPGQDTREERSRVGTLLTLSLALERIARELDAKREQLARATTEDQRVALTEDARELQAEYDDMHADFDSIATGIDVDAFDAGPDDEFDLQTELLKLVEPIVEELKDATEGPRQLESLRSSIQTLDQRERLARNAVASLDAQIAAVERATGIELDPGERERLLVELARSREAWEKRRRAIADKLAVESFQLEKRLSDRTSILEATQSAVSNFFRTRGLHLLMAIGTFFAVLFGVRWLYRRILRLLPGKSREARRFYARLSDVLTFALAGVFALMGALLVLYAAGDWVLLGLALLFILGIAWASKTAVPMFLEQIRLLLDLGTVREHERIMYGGIPYKVSRLSMNAMLTNPELAGGIVRLPLKDLMDLRSRPCAKEELWFPCRRGEWVLLSDGLRGKVLHQSPEFVQLESIGGARTTFVTTDFLGLAPKNLSHGFRTKVTFGIDYAHQPIATSEVPRIMLDRLAKGLKQQFDPEQIVKLNVEFQTAGASSLDYVVLADWAGESARAYEVIQRAIQRILVDTCNEQGWGIPFTQITLHQAVPAN